MSSSQDEIRCAVCNKEASKFCNNCRAIKCCSKQCQKDDWYLHKLLCHAFKNLGEREEGDAGLAILFPAEEDDPQLQYKYRNKRSALQEMLGVDKLGPDEEISFGTFEYIPDEFDRRLVFHFREGFLVDGSVKNKSIMRFTQGDVEYEWCGPVLVTRDRGDECAPSDITASDLGAIANFFAWYGSSTGQGYLAKPDWTIGKPLENEVRGVEVARQIDQEQLGVRPYKSKNFGPEYLAFCVNTVSSISRRLGFPLIVFQKLPPRDKPHGNKVSDQSCEDIALAMMDIDPDSLSWGQIPDDWRNSEYLGYVVSREDENDLEEQQVEAFVKFCCEKLPLLFEDRTDLGGSTKWARDEVLQFINKLNFEYFFEEYRSRKLREIYTEHQDVNDEMRRWAAVRCPTRV